MGSARKNKLLSTIIKNGLNESKKKDAEGMQMVGLGETEASTEDETTLLIEQQEDFEPTAPPTLVERINPLYLVCIIFISAAFFLKHFYIEQQKFKALATFQAVMGLFVLIMLYCLNTSQ